MLTKEENKLVIVIFFCIVYSHSYSEGRYIEKCETQGKQFLNQV